jgi:hypothetical protein
MASNQVTAILFSASFAKCDFAQQLCDFVTSSAIHLHSSTIYMLYKKLPNMQKMHIANLGKNNF